MKLTDKIHLLKIDFEITLSPEKKLPRFVNVIMIFGEKITLIDTGVKGSEGKIFDYIKQSNRDFSEIASIIISHSHPDHIGSAAKIKELTGCRVLAHEAEKEWIENIEIQNIQRPVPGFFNLVDRSVTVDEYLFNGQEILSADGLSLEIIHSPGHSKGSVNIAFKEDKILFTADSIPLKNDIPNYDNFIDLMKSLDKIRENKEFKVLLTSWTPPLTDRDEINRLLSEGTDYMNRIDAAVHECYGSGISDSLDSCKATVERLGLPPFLVNPLVDKAFKSHILMG
jgi:hydroxyacylglutathione hydrolase